MQHGLHQGILLESISRLEGHLLDEVLDLSTFEFSTTWTQLKI